MTESITEVAIFNGNMVLFAGLSAIRHCEIVKSLSIRVQMAPLSYNCLLVCSLKSLNSYTILLAPWASLCI